MEEKGSRDYHTDFKDCGGKKKKNTEKNKRKNLQKGVGVEISM